MASPSLENLNELRERYDLRPHNNNADNKCNVPLSVNPLELYDNAENASYPIATPGHRSAPDAVPFAVPVAPVSHWTDQQVQQWVRDMNFDEKVINAFATNKVDGRLLLSLTDAELANELHLTQMLPRRRLLNEISKLRGGNIPTFKAAPEDLEDDRALNSVVKIFCTSTTPNYSMPWQMKRQSFSTSSGFVISGRRILGNAHGVTNQTAVRIRRHGDATKYPARVLHTAHECDLVMLTVDDERFWVGMEPLDFGGVPKLQESVTVVGYPTGGDNVSVTKGVVSRVVVSHYTHSGESLLTIQIDAAINSGNSGGPAMQGNKIVGVAFETLSSAQNIGYIIPVPIILHFLEDIDRHKRYTGFPVLGFIWQTMENESLRRFYNVPENSHGILVTHCMPLADSAKKLKVGDVVCKIDGETLADDGTIDFRKGERISFRHLASRKFMGEELKVDILRQGQPLQVQLKVGPRSALVPLHLHDKLPTYLVYAGFVFTPLSRSFLYHEWGKDWQTKAPVNFVRLATEGIQEEANQEVVVLSQVLVDDVNAGYQKDVHNLVVDSVNGTPVRSMRSMVKAIYEAESNEDFLFFVCEGDKHVVLETKLAKEATPRILAQNNIAKAMSNDLLQYLESVGITPHVAASTGSVKNACRSLGPFAQVQEVKHAAHSGADGSSKKEESEPNGQYNQQTVSASVDRLHSVGTQMSKSLPEVPHPAAPAVGHSEAPQVSSAAPATSS